MVKLILKSARVQAKLSLFLTKHHTMNMYGRVKVELCTLSLALDEGRWSTSQHIHFTPQGCL